MTVGRRVKLLIVDDSALMRRQLSAIFAAEGRYEIYVARNGREAVEANRTLLPDVVTLDINMPEMDGLTALSLMMAERPVPVVMVSSLTETGALATFEALNLGAVDYVAKPDGTISRSIEAIREQLLEKVRAAAGARIKGPARAPVISAPPSGKDTVGTSRPSPEAGVVVIGVSTGGPRTLEEILPRLPGDFPWPVLVAQHMPATFSRAFAERLDRLCALRVVEASQPLSIEPGTIYIGRGGADMVVARRNGRLTVLPRPENPAFLWHPSVELLGRSVLEHCDPRKVVAVLLTGMGYDGAEAFAAIKERGGWTIAESEESAVVFGMPAELIRRGGASCVAPATRVAAEIVAAVNRGEKLHAAR